MYETAIGSDTKGKRTIFKEEMFMRKRRIAFILVFAMLLQLVPLPQGVLAGVGDLFPKTEAAVGDSVASGTTGNLKWSIVEEKMGDGWISSSDTAYKLTITGSGSMPDYKTVSYVGNKYTYYKTAAPWSDYALGIQTVEIGEGVTNISQNAFYGCNAITSITIPSGVTKIGNYAFRDCTHLKNVSLPEGLQTLGNYAFMSCTDLTSVKIPSSLTSIGSSAFWLCSVLQEILLGNSKITEVPSHAFYSCRKLNKVTLPNTVKIISDSCFGNCSELSDIALPNSLETIGVDSFTSTAIKELVIPKSVTKIEGNPYCNGQLQTITVDPDNKNYVSVDNILIELKGETYYKAVCYPCNAENDIVVPAPIEEIGDSAFKETAAKNITFPASLKTIGLDAFYKAAKLESVSIPGNVKSIGDNAFRNCTMLSNIKLGTGLESIGKYAFQDCNIAQIELPDKITSIDRNAFSNCKKLQSVSLPNSITEIGESVFDSCTSLETVEIGQKLETISGSVFDNCPKLANIKIS